MPKTATSAYPPLRPTPTANPGLPKILGEFETLTASLDYAARGVTGFNFYSARSELSHVMPFRDLRESAVNHALRLSASGIKPGERVALLAANTPDFLVHFFACQYAGIIPVPMPLPTAFGRREAYVAQIRNQIVSATPSMLLGLPDYLPMITEAVEGRGLKRISTYADVATWTETSGQLHQARADELSYIQYSSGSTRFPTGVCVTHRALMKNCSAMSHAVENFADQRAVSWLPFFHDMGLVGFMLAVLASQTSTDYLATEDFARRPLTWLRLISENRATMSYSPSFGYELCARRVQTMPEGSLGLDLSSWRIAGIGGEMIKPQVMQMFGETFKPYGFRELAFNGSYGLAECVLGVSFSRPLTGMTLDHIAKDGLATHLATPVPNDGSPMGRTFVGCGVVIKDHNVEIRDVDDAHVLGQREIGRVYFSGPSVMTGYYNDPRATAETLIDGWLDTGDLGYWLGYELFIVGRAKDMMIVNGRNVWPQDIEWTVEHMDGMRSGDSAAIVLVDSQDNERPTILVQCRPANVEERGALIADIKARVQEAIGILCDVVLVPPRSLPKTTSGKLARGKAKTMFEAGEITALDT
ncbi:MAG: fatty acyl-AMP ligase [Alphaproteobacteria bacterium]|nr:fatty acyl-AMP ligase [Alphaproteobacteria bacterium]PHY01706.1 MAG: acyl-CoA synthetase [Rhodospirillaceae bacterium]